MANTETFFLEWVSMENGKCLVEVLSKELEMIWERKL
jgi:hypothetical protein